VPQGDDTPASAFRTKQPLPVRVATQQAPTNPCPSRSAEVVNAIVQGRHRARRRRPALRSLQQRALPSGGASAWRESCIVHEHRGSTALVQRALRNLAGDRHSELGRKLKSVCAASTQTASLCEHDVLLGTVLGAPRPHAWLSRAELIVCLATGYLPGNVASTPFDRGRDERGGEA
jgi:hypothetical protein